MAKAKKAAPKKAAAKKAAPKKAAAKKAAPKKAAAKKVAPQQAAPTPPRTVTIRDAGLVMALEEVLRAGAVNGQEVDLDALASETKIDWSDAQAEAFPDRWRSIAALDGIEHATSLRHLSVWGNGSDSLAPLAPLTELEEVWAFDNQIETAAGLANKPKL